MPQRGNCAVTGRMQQTHGCVGEAPASCDLTSRARLPRHENWICGRVDAAALRQRHTRPAVASTCGGRCCKCRRSG